MYDLIKNQFCSKLISIESNPFCIVEKGLRLHLPMKRKEKGQKERRRAQRSPSPANAEYFLKPHRRLSCISSTLAWDTLPKVLSEVLWQKNCGATEAIKDSCYTLLQNVLIYILGSWKFCLDAFFDHLWNEAPSYLLKFSYEHHAVKHYTWRPEYTRFWDYTQ